MNRLFSYILLTFLTSCSIKYYQTDKKYVRPVDPNVFTYKRDNFILNNSIIDTTKIYCNAYPIDKPEYYDCYRFFGNGRLMTYRFFGKIDTAVFRDINTGGIGYYHVDNNIIRTQEFTVFAEHTKEGGGGRLIHFYGTIHSDTIKMDPENISKRYNAKPRLGQRNYYLDYKKTSIDAPSMTTNW
jgi:hypothetical protein